MRARVCVCMNVLCVYERGASFFHCMAFPSHSLFLLLTYAHQNEYVNVHNTLQFKHTQNTIRERVFAVKLFDLICRAPKEEVQKPEPLLEFQMDQTVPIMSC